MRQENKRTTWLVEGVEGNKWEVENGKVPDWPRGLPHVTVVRVSDARGARIDSERDAISSVGLLCSRENENP